MVNIQVPLPSTIFILPFVSCFLFILMSLILSGYSAEKSSYALVLVPPFVSALQLTGLNKHTEGKRRSHFPHKIYQHYIKLKTMAPCGTCFLSHSVTYGTSKLQDVVVQHATVSGFLKSKVGCEPVPDLITKGILWIIDSLGEHWSWEKDKYRTKQNKSKPRKPNQTKKKLKKPKLVLIKLFHYLSCFFPIRLQGNSTRFSQFSTRWLIQPGIKYLLWVSLRKAKGKQEHTSQN